MGYFALTASFSPAGITALREMTATRMKANLDEVAEKLGGRVVDLYFKASNLSLLAILDLPSAGSSGPLLQLMASGAFEAGADMMRVETSEELDAALGG